MTPKLQIELMRGYLESVDLGDPQGAAYRISMALQCLKRLEGPPLTVAESIAEDYCFAEKWQDLSDELRDWPEGTPLAKVLDLMDQIEVADAWGQGSYEDKAKHL